MWLVATQILDIHKHWELKLEWATAWKMGLTPEDIQELAILGGVPPKWRDDGLELGNQVLLTWTSLHYGLLLPLFHVLAIPATGNHQENAF